MLSILALTAILTIVLYTMCINNNMKYYYTFLCLNITTIVTLQGMHDPGVLTSLPNFVLCTILRYISTEQILKFREVDKRAQKVAELLLSTDYSKKITINYTLYLPIELLKKLLGIKLQLDGQYMSIAGFLINKVSHIKALELYIPNIMDNAEKSHIKTLLTQLESLEVLKIVYSSTKFHAKQGSYHTQDLLKALSLYTNLKNLHVNFGLQGQACWDTFLQLLTDLKKLQVLHIEGYPSFSRQQFFTFTQALQQLTLLKKLCLYGNTITEQEADIFGRSLSTLKNIRVLNLRKSTMAHKDFQKIKELLPMLQNSTSYEPQTRGLLKIYRDVFKKIKEQNIIPPNEGEFFYMTTDVPIMTPFNLYSM